MFDLSAIVGVRALTGRRRPARPRPRRGAHRRRPLHLRLRLRLGRLPLRHKGMTIYLSLNKLLHNFMQGGSSGLIAWKVDGITLVSTVPPSSVFFMC